MEAAERAYELFSKWMDIRQADLNAVMDDYVNREGKTNGGMREWKNWG